MGYSYLGRQPEIVVVIVVRVQYPACMAWMMMVNLLYYNSTTTSSGDIQHERSMVLLEISMEYVVYIRGVGILPI